jgi:hypothetical protein
VETRRRGAGGRIEKDGNGRESAFKWRCDTFIGLKEELKEIVEQSFPSVVLTTRGEGGFTYF